jgi:hypothetical protein
MSWQTRHAKEIRRLLALGRPISALRDDTDENGRPYTIAATLRKVGSEYHFFMDLFYPIGTTGETIREEGRVFDDIEQALRYLEDMSGIPLYQFKV